MKFNEKEINLFASNLNFTKYIVNQCQDKSTYLIVLSNQGSTKSKCLKMQK